ncbi:MAG: Uma2 family endonuclease [Cyanobacteria bacterium P01_G01_bin.49]
MMNTKLRENETETIILQLSPPLEMTDEQFFHFCHLNRDYRFEKTVEGQLIIMSPTGSETGNRNFNLVVQLGIWIEKNGKGIGFDSSTGFKLPNGANRSPDAAWMTLEKWEAIEPKKREKFAPVCPDFVVEIRSPSDNLETLQSKLQEYINNGVQLGWLIDRKNQKVYIYRPNQPFQCLDNPNVVEGEGLISGFFLNRSKIW